MSQDRNTLITSYPKDKIKILLLENISPSAYEYFKQKGYHNITCCSEALPEEQLKEQIKDVHILGIRSKTQVSQEILNNAKKLLAIGCFCIGTNQVDLNIANLKGITVFNSPHSNTRSVAELVIGSSIMLIRKIVEKNNAAHKGIWLKKSNNSYEIRGKTMGIIGYGNIGTQVGILAEALGIRVIFYDIVKKLPLGNVSQVNTLEELVSQSDIITAHVPEDVDTINLIDENIIRKCKQGAILINYARGKIVDLEALHSALVSDHISGAAIDVFPAEPEKNGDSFHSVLQHLDNVLLTPHIGGSTEEAQRNIGEDVSIKVMDYLEKGISVGSHSIPEVSLPTIGKAHRILHIHKNVPSVISEISTVLAKRKINIQSQYLRTNKDVGYVVYDVSEGLSLETYRLLRSLPNTIKTRLLY